MRIEPIASGPASVSQESPQQSARDRAISQLLGAAPQVDQNNIQAEDASAVKEQEPLVGQADKIVSPEASQEETKEPKADDSEKEPPLSAQYANLARKEKALRAEAQKLKAERAAFESQRRAPEAPKAVEPAFDPSKYIPKDRLSQDPLAVLAEAGLNYDQLTELMLNQSKPDPVMNAALDSLKAEIKALKDAQDEAKKYTVDQQQNQYKQAVAQIKSEVNSLVNTDPYYETIQKTGSVQDVVDLIETTFKETGELLSVEQAAKEVEDYLEEQLTGYTSRIEKIKKKLQPASAAPVASSEKQEPPKQPQQMKTLTNSVGTTRQLSAKERAILAFKGEIKN